MIEERVDTSVPMVLDDITADTLTSCLGMYGVGSSRDKNVWKNINEKEKQVQFELTLLHQVLFCLFINFNNTHPTAK